MKINNIKNKLIIIIVATMLILNIVYPSNVFAAATASISASSSTITAGESTTISIKVANTETWQFTITSNGGSLSETSNADAYGSEKTTTAMTSTFSCSNPGTYTISFVGTVAGSDFVKKSVSGSTTVTVKEKETPPPSDNTGNNNNGGTSNNGNSGGSNNSKPTTMPSETGSNNKNNNNQEKPKSSNNYLSSMSIVGGGKLSPEFYRETYDYTVEFDETVNLYELNEIEIEATVEDERASVKGIGKVELQEGENNLSVTVTAENGSERAYNLKVVKPKKVEQSELRLKTLVLNGIDKEGVYQTISFNLDPETFEYDLTVPNEITALSINPTTENEDIIIEKIGGESLEEGDNKIDIILTSPSDKEVQTTYTLNVKREAAIVQVQGLTKNQIIMIVAGVVGLIILIVAIVLIVKHSKKKKQNGYDTSELNFTENLEDNNFEENRTEEKIDTVDDIELPKLNWLDSNETPKEKEQNEENKDQKEDKKSGKRFL